MEEVVEAVVAGVVHGGGEQHAQHRHRRQRRGGAAAAQKHARGVDDVGGVGRAVVRDLVVLRAASRSYTYLWCYNIGIATG